jgi:membrane protein
MNDEHSPAKPSRHHLWRIAKRTLAKSWDDSIFSEAAQAAFWCALSLPPLLLGMLGSLAYIAPLFGPDTLQTIEDRLVSTAGSLFSSNVVNEIIQPTVSDIVAGARGEVVSLGFVISLWAGSSAVSAFVDSVVEAHDQTELRHPVRQRFFALGLYVVGLVFVIATAPLLAIGPMKVAEHIPESWQNVLSYGYYPVLFIGLVTAINILYRVHLRSARDTDRVLVVRLLPRLRDHDGGRAQRRNPGGVARPRYPRQAAAGLAGGQGRGTQRRRGPRRTGHTPRCGYRRRRPTGDYFLSCW